jgi:uncharacterized membrane protein
MQLAGVLVWWFLISAIGLIAFPITFKVFRFLPDRGYTFSKPLGLLLTGLLTWLIGYVSFSRLTIILSILLIAGFSYWLWIHYKEEMVAFFRQKKGYILGVELFFAFVYLLFLFFRMYNPDVIGTEKFMDLAFMNAITRATSFPPFDPWLAGKGFTISYYYLGYLLMAILTKLSAVPPAVAFNLALGSLFALSGLSLLGLLYNLTQRLSLAIGGWAAIFMLGNLDGFRQVLVTRSLDNFNWWTPSRVIPDTINEFPFFSFLLGDMHPHMLSIPFVLLALAFGLNHIKSDESLIAPNEPERAGRYVLWGLVIGSLGFMNSWDLPTTYFVAMLSIFFQQFRQQTVLAWTQVRAMLTALGVILAAAFIPYLPFYFNFHSQAKGIGWTTQNTSAGDFLLIFGLFVFLTVSFLAARYHAWFLALLTQPDRKAVAGKKRNLACPECGAALRDGKRICGQCGFQIKSSDMEEDASSPLLLPVTDTPAWGRNFLMFLLQPVEFSRKNDIRTVALFGLAVLVLLAAALFFKSFFLAVILLLAVAAGLLLCMRADRPETVFALSLLFTAWLLVAGCELLHIKDTFNAPLDRMNTVFKFYYQAWFLMGVAGVYGLYWAFRYSFRNLNLKLAWTTGLAMLVAASLVYPYASVMIKTNHFYNDTSLDGSAFLNNTYAPDRDAIEWMRRNVNGTPVVLEATGGEYTDFARVSTFTGLPTVLGWGGHELQWRGNWDEPGKRIPDIDTLYGSPEIDRAKSLIEKYQIDYIFVGTLERQKYPAASLAKFAAFMDRVYTNPGGVVIYKSK